MILRRVLLARHALPVLGLSIRIYDSRLRLHWLIHIGLNEAGVRDMVIRRVRLLHVILGLGDLLLPVQLLLVQVVLIELDGVGLRLEKQLVLLMELLLAGRHREPVGLQKIEHLSLRVALRIVLYLWLWWRLLHGHLSRHSWLVSRRIRARSGRSWLGCRLFCRVVLSDAVVHVGLELSAFLVRQLLQVKLQGLILAGDAVLHDLVDAH